MIELLYLAHNRLEFTRASFQTMLRNTNWSLVSSITIYDDGSTDGTADFLEQAASLIPGAPCFFQRTEFGGPVAVMNDFIPKCQASIFAKIDNDVMLPPGWLNDGLAVMEQHPEVDLLGIEAFHPVADPPSPRTPVPAEFIGGIGLMRTRAFRTLPVANGRMGFTHWQIHNDHVKKAWINPALPVFLLNLVPTEPWAGYSREFIRQAWQRDWPPVYSLMKFEELSGWWKL